MATGLGSAGANTALNALVAAYPWVKLHVGDPGAAGTSNAAAETTRKQVDWNAASGGSITNSADETWSPYGASEDPTHFTLWTASTAGTFGMSGTITSDALVSGNTATLAAGAMTLSFTLAS